MKSNVVLGIFILIGIIGIVTGCSLESSSEFNCGTGANETLVQNPPADTSFVQIESVDLKFNRTFIGIRNGEDSTDPVNENYDNLSLYEREPDQPGSNLYGLGTRIIDQTDSAAVVLAFNFFTGDDFTEFCRSTKVFQSEHDWSKWNENIGGVEIIVTLPIDGKWVTFSTDASQEDDDILRIDGAEFLDERGFYARLSGNYTTKLSEADTEDPLEVDVTGSFILDMRVSR